MLEEDIDDTHLCIKCNSTIIGLVNYIQHRKSSCSNGNNNNRNLQQQSELPEDSNPSHTTIDHSYGGFDFNETPSTNHDHHDVSEKVHNYDYNPYDLGADIFFQSLQLQSSTKRNPTVATTTSNTTVSSNFISPSGGKTHKILTRKAAAELLHQNDEWILSPQHGKSNRNSPFITFPNDSPDPSEVELDTDDEDYNPNSIPPASHTGGKWKPGGRSSVLLRNSPAWSQNHWEVGEKPPNEIIADDYSNPPPGHTKGKWVPGTKITKLDYKEEVEIEKIYSDQYWCNVCNRKLASKILYEKHLKTKLHVKRSKPEIELEQARLKPLSERLNKRTVYFSSLINEIDIENPDEVTSKKRKRRRYFIKCETCKIRLPKYLLGKHLISHYHYRRMILHPEKSFNLILQNMPKIVRQCPFQCQPCKFYTNTEEYFIEHWDSSNHCAKTQEPGLFWCSFCKFECKENNQMRRHLLGTEHKDVISAINRSVPIFIGKKVFIECSRCQQNFRYNFELRKHSEHCEGLPTGTASNVYQSKKFCDLCLEVFKSKSSLQKHLKVIHKTNNYFCTLCGLEFTTNEEAQLHRNSSNHKANLGKNMVPKKCRICENIFSSLKALKEHISSQHEQEKSVCPHCNKSFNLPQELGRHIRDKLCQIRDSRKKNMFNLDINLEQVTTGELLTVSDHLEIQTHIQIEPYLEDLQEIDELTIKEFYCGKCSFKTNLNSELLYHDVLHSVTSSSSNATKLTCPLCSKIFRKNSLRCHLRQHTNEKIFKCTECDTGFARKHNLKSHIQNIHRSKVEIKKIKKKIIPRRITTQKKNSHFQCDTCGKVFKKKFVLKQHILTHSSRPRRFKCDNDSCLFVGRNFYDLKIHLTTHSTEKLCKCDFKGCTYEGKNIVSLRKHQKIHSKTGKEYECSNCPYKTRYPTHLKRHLRIHSGEKPYQCPYCDYTSNNSENLRKHVLKKERRHLYECKLCIDQEKSESEIFKSNYIKEYQKHLAIKHGEQKKLDEFIVIVD